MIFITRAVLYVYFKLDLMRFWSRLHAWLFERKTQEPLKRFEDLGKLVAYVKTLKWRPDTWRDLWDATSSIGAIQWRATYEPHKLIGDCDEFGRYSACVIRQELDNGGWAGFGIKESYLLTIMWKNITESTGHNVCLIEYWDGTFAYMDYGMPSVKRPTIEDVVADVRHRYNNSEFVGLAWAVSNPETLHCLGVALE